MEDSGLEGNIMKRTLGYSSNWCSSSVFVFVSWISQLTSKEYPVFL